MHKYFISFYCKAMFHWMDILHLFIHSIDGNMGFIHFLLIVNNDAMNSYVYSSGNQIPTPTPALLLLLFAVIIVLCLFSDFFELILCCLLYVFTKVSALLALWLAKNCINILKCMEPIIFQVFPKELCIFRPGFNTQPGIWELLFSLYSSLHRASKSA